MQNLIKTDYLELKVWFVIAQTNRFNLIHFFVMEVTANFTNFSKGRRDFCQTLVSSRENHLEHFI